MENNDLWPDFNDVPKIVSPRTILAQQAAILSEKTKQLVTGEIINIVSTGGEQNIAYIFNIVAPLLKGYKYNLLTLRHGIFYYPCTLVFRNAGMTIANEEALKEKLRIAFADDSTVRAIQSLIGQSKDLQS